MRKIIVSILLLLFSSLCVWSQPVLVTPIPNQYAKEGVAYSFQFDAGTFSGSGLNYSAFINRPNHGISLPSWLTFTPATRTFSGTPSDWKELEAL